MTRASRRPRSRSGCRGPAEVGALPALALELEDRVDPETCLTREGLGKDALSGVWTDEDFDPDQHAMYYVRVLEEPVCRYSTLWCRAYIGVDPLDPDCAGQLESRDRLHQLHGAACCSNDEPDPSGEAGLFVQPLIQERAWTSPIWYEPSAAAEPSP